MSTTVKKVIGPVDVFRLEDGTLWELEHVILSREKSGEAEAIRARGSDGRQNRTFNGNPAGFTFAIVIGEKLVADGVTFDNLPMIGNLSPTLTKDTDGNVTGFRWDVKKSSGQKAEKKLSTAELQSRLDKLRAEKAQTE